MSFRGPPKEYVNPLLQPPLNKLFLPRPTLDYLPPIDRDQHERTYVRVLPTAHYMHLLHESNNVENASDQPTTPKSLSKKEIALAKWHKAKEELEAACLKCKLTIYMYFTICVGNPHTNENAKSDAFKTLFVGRLPYSVKESELRREFERYGPVKSIYMVNDLEGKPRGYAFIEFEREKDMKVAYVEADGMRLPGHSTRIVVDVERGRTVKGWLPRRLGGGLGRTRVGGKDVNQRHSGRDNRANDLLDDLSSKRAIPASSSSSDRDRHRSSQYRDSRYR